MQSLHRQEQEKLAACNEELQAQKSCQLQQIDFLKDQVKQKSE